MGLRVKIVCAGTCGTSFTYVKKSNFQRKFCDKCAAARTQASKQRYLEAQREERKHESSMKKKLEEIPDFPLSPYKLLDAIGRDLS
jgi:hypothetical protein